MNLKYIPGLSESYFEIDSDTGDFTLSIVGCLPSDDLGNPVSDYTNAVKTLKWSSTAIATGLMSSTINEERDEIIGYATSTTGNCLAYIKGNMDFFGRTFKVDRRVYVPNPETEMMVRAFIEETSTGSTILEVGTGCGCIAITLAKEASYSKIYASFGFSDTL